MQREGFCESGLPGGQARRRPSARWGLGFAKTGVALWRQTKPRFKLGQLVFKRLDDIEHRVRDLSRQRLRRAS